MRHILAATLFFAAVLPDTGILAQQPFSGGSAAGYGVAATNEARGGVGGAWNPALAHFDLPSPGRLTIGIDYFARPGAAPLLGLARHVLGTESPASHRVVSELGRLPFVEGLAETSGRGTVLWFAARQDGYTASLATRAWFHAYVPGALRVLARGGDPNQIEAPFPWSRSILVTELALARAFELGAFPILGPLWTGAGVRIRHAHRSGIGRWSDATSGRDFEWADFTNELGSSGSTRVIRFDELSLEGRQAAMLDIGAIAQPFDPVVLGLTLVDFAAIERGGELHLRDRLFAQGDSGFVVLGRDEERLRDRSTHALGDRLYDATRPAPRIRAAASIETIIGRLFAGGEKRLARRITLDSPATASWSVGWAYPACSWLPRFSASGQPDGDLAFAGAITAPLGDFRLDLELRHLHGRALAFGLSLHLSRTARQSR